MEQITQEKLEVFLEKVTGTRNLFNFYESIGIYGSKDFLFQKLEQAISLSMSYLKCDFQKIFNLFSENNQKHPNRHFDSINKELYQDKNIPAIITIMYAFSEPFLLRELVKQEILYLVFNLEKINKIFIAGIGIGKIFESLAKIPQIKNQSEISIKGVDISSPSIKFCQIISSNYQFNLSLETLDLDSYEPEEKFDLTEISEILEHLRNPEFFLAKAADFSKIILVTIPIMLDSPDHLHLFDLSKIKKMIAEANLSPVYETIRNSFFIKQFFYFALLGKA